MILCPIAPSIMYRVANRYVQDSQAILERGVSEFFHSRNSYAGNITKKKPLCPITETYDFSYVLPLITGPQTF